MGEVDKKGGKPETAGAAKRLNDGIDLSKFMYKGEFIGEQYTAYLELVNGKFEEDEAGRMNQVSLGLSQTVNYDFVGYKVTQMKKLLYPKSKVDKTTITIGFKIVEETPFRTTINNLRNIKILNEQLDNNNGKIPMIYYLLAKY